jgi:hypothetical protein
MIRLRLGSCKVSVFFFIVDAAMPHEIAPTEDRAWEIFVRLVGNGTRPADAISAAFEAVQVFGDHCEQRRESLESNTIAKSGDEAAQARAENARHSADPSR